MSTTNDGGPIMPDTASKMPARIWADLNSPAWSRSLDPVSGFDSAMPYYRADIVERMAEALEAAAARFNLMSGIGPANGVDPKVGYREAMQALNSYREASNVES